MYIQLKLNESICFYPKLSIYQSFPLEPLITESKCKKKINFLSNTGKIG